MQLQVEFSLFVFLAEDNYAHSLICRIIGTGRQEQIEWRYIAGRCHGQESLYIPQAIGKRDMFGIFRSLEIFQVIIAVGLFEWGHGFQIDLSVSAG